MCCSTLTQVDALTSVGDSFWDDLWMFLRMFRTLYGNAFKGTDVVFTGNGKYVGEKDNCCRINLKHKPFHITFIKNFIF